MKKKSGKKADTKLTKRKSKTSNWLGGGGWGRWV
jgi:hypothetical protein